jgi:hypothetical protein
VPELQFLPPAGQMADRMTRAQLRPSSAVLRPCLSGAYRTHSYSFVSKSPNQAAVAPQPFKDTGPAVLPNNWLNSHSAPNGCAFAPGVAGSFFIQVTP